MKISLKDQIVIFDEAHNIEDVARDAASAVITGVELEEAVEELDQMSETCIWYFQSHWKRFQSVMLENVIGQTRWMVLSEFIFCL